MIVDPKYLYLELFAHNISTPEIFDRRSASVKEKINAERTY